MQPRSRRNELARKALGKRTVGLVRYRARLNNRLDSVGCSVLTRTRRRKDHDEVIKPLALDVMRAPHDAREQRDSARVRNFAGWHGCLAVEPVDRASV